MSETTGRVVLVPGLAVISTLLLFGLQGRSPQRRRPLTIQFFSSPAADPSGSGEGKTFLGQKEVRTNRRGNPAPSPSPRCSQRERTWQPVGEMRQSRAMSVEQAVAKSWKSGKRSRPMSGSIRTPGFEAVLVTLAAFREGEESNNSTWVDIRIRNGRAKVVGYGPT